MAVLRAVSCWNPRVVRHRRAARSSAPAATAKGGAGADDPVPAKRGRPRGRYGPNSARRRELERRMLELDEVFFGKPTEREAGGEPEDVSWAARARERVAPERVQRGRETARRRQKEQQRREARAAARVERKSRQAEAEAAAAAAAAVREAGRAELADAMPRAARWAAASRLTEAAGADEVLAEVERMGAAQDAPPAGAAAALERLARAAERDPERSVIRRRPAARELVARVAADAESGLLEAPSLAAAARATATLGGAAALRAELESILAAAVRKADLVALRAPEAAELAWALGTARHADADVLAAVGVAAERGSPTWLQGLAPAPFAALLWGCAAVGDVPPALLGSLESWAEAAGALRPGVLGGRPYAEFKPAELCRCIWALAALGAEGKAYELAWAEAARRGAHGMGRAPRALRQLHQAALVGAAVGAPPRVPASLAMAARRAWETERDDPVDSAMQRYVLKALRALGHTPEPEADLGGYLVDGLLRDLAVVVEADGPTHFTRNTRAPVGSTRLKHRTLQALGWRTLSVPAWEWSELADETAEREYLSERLSNLEA
mmetsp:Transcript_24314/g.83110  ORF Transcript_24314/g.83110 Transcript_24314/m.83110 type:complete len:559 (-) Transcript_24314:4826-6502(-)